MILRIRDLLAYTLYTMVVSLVGVGARTSCSEGGKRKCGVVDGRDWSQYRSNKEKNGIAINPVPTSIPFRVVIEYQQMVPDDAPVQPDHQANKPIISL